MKTTYEWDESKTKVWHFMGQNCSDMMITVDWKSFRFKDKHFYSASKYATDYGTCCAIFPFIDFENSTSGRARNGLKNGLFLVLDVESYDYGFFSRRSEGFRVTTSNALDTPIGDGSGFRKLDPDSGNSSFGFWKCYGVELNLAKILKKNKKKKSWLKLHSTHLIAGQKI